MLFSDSRPVGAAIFSGGGNHGCIRDDGNFACFFRGENGIVANFATTVTIGANRKDSLPVEVGRDSQLFVVLCVIFLGEQRQGSGITPDKSETYRLTSAV